MKHLSKDIKEAVGYMGLELESGGILGLWNGKGPHVPSLESLAMILSTPSVAMCISPETMDERENQRGVGEIGLQTDKLEAARQ